MSAEPDTTTRNLRLDVIRGNAAGRTIDVDEELTIGRESSPDGRLGDDLEISRRHARISRSPGGGFEIEDLGSTNGTFVNGRRLEGPHGLSTGDTIGVGETLLVATVSDRAPGTPVDEPGGHGPWRTVLAPPGASAPAATPAPPGGPAGAPPGGAARTTPPPATGVDERPRLVVRLEVDWETREVSVTLGDDVAPLRLVHEDGRWHAGRDERVGGRE